MLKVLRIIFCILAVCAAAAAIFVFVFAGWAWGILTVALCLGFAAAMILCKNAQARQEQRDNPPAPTGDFITGKVKKDDREE